jgi:predicted phage tail protein|tara:strand:+ start:2007 stop:2612 length:606 start_codon:yes stop_codon:yes gene_type:complete
MLRKVKLYGELAKFVGHKEFEVNADTVGKAISFLIHNFPGLEKHMSPKYYQVKVGNYEIEEQEINYPVGSEDIHFVPVIQGAGRGIGKFLLGAAMIGLAFAMPGAVFQGFGGFSAAAGYSGFQAAIGNIGIALALSGVSDMLFPLPQPQKFSSEEDPQLSFSFSGVQNTSRAGTPIPIVYGEMMTGSVVISAAVDTNQVDV